MATSGIMNKPLGIAIMAAGAGFAYWGFQKSEGIESQLSSTLTGSHSDNVMLLYIGAGVCLAVGAFLLMKK